MRRVFKIATSLAVACLILAAPVGADAPPPPDFTPALPGYVYQFPRDFFSHDDYRIEWWYYTGNLQGEAGREFGYQLTFFRVALEGKKKIENPSKWKADQVYFAHLTVSDLADKKFYYFERINRRGLGAAGAATDRLRVWNEDWTLAGDAERHELSAVENGVGLKLVATPDKPIVQHGRDGVSQKGRETGNASHYFSSTRMTTRGEIFINGKSYKVAGTSWMDHEFSSDQLNPKLAGWDWFSIKLDAGAEIMLYQLRHKDGSVDPYSSGTLIRADGSARRLENSRFEIRALDQWTSNATGIAYPSGWSITLADPPVDLKIQPDLKNQELANLRSISSSYWEGSVSVRGSYNGSPARGKGYVELVGYGKPLASARRRGQ